MHCIASARLDACTISPHRCARTCRCHRAVACSSDMPSDEEIEEEEEEWPSRER
jgi:hypothetical protein